MAETLGSAGGNRMDGSSLFGLKGRINRARYWLFFLVAVPVIAALFVAYYGYAMSFPGAYENGGPTPLPSTPSAIAGAAVWWSVFAALVLAWAGLTVRRLHDRDRPWWWLLVFFVFPNCLDVFSRYGLRAQLEPSPGAALIIAGFAFALNLWGVVETGFLRGTPGDNRYGPNPARPTA